MSNNPTDEAPRNLDRPVATLETVVTDAILGELAGVPTGCPGKIVSYVHGKQRAEVQPIIRGRFKGDTEGTRLPTIADVPVMFPQGGGFTIIWDLAVGDDVWLTFGDRSLDEWLAAGGDDVDPAILRRHDLADAVALAGISPFSSPNPHAAAGELVLTDGTRKIRVTGSAVILTDGAGATIQAQNGKATMTATKADVVAGGNSLIQQLIDTITALEAGAPLTVPGVAPGTGILSPAVVIALDAIKTILIAMKA